MDISRLSDTDKIAILMIGLGEEVAAQIFRHLPQNDALRISQAIRRLGKVDSSVLQEVFHDFHRILQQNKKLFPAGEEFASKVIHKAFKGEKAECLLNELQKHRQPQLTALSLYQPKSLAHTIQREHPQTIALILAHLDGKSCAATLKLLPDSLWLEVIYRMAHLESVAAETLEEIDDFLRREAEQGLLQHEKKIGGIEKVAQLLNVMDADFSNQLLQGLAERNSKLTDEIRQKMFVFSDLLKIDSLGIQALLKATATSTWQVALRGVPRELSEHVFSCMSARAGKILKEDMLAMPKVRVIDVQNAQKQILDVAQKLIDEGRIIYERDQQQYVK
jgi:flagellar motor switch protein FliG